MIVLLSFAPHAKAVDVDVTATPDKSPRDLLLGATFDPNSSDAVKALFYETGMNCVRMQGGGYEFFSEPQKKLAAEFAPHNISLYLQLGSHYPSGDYFNLPPDTRFVDQNGASGTPDKTVWAINYSNTFWPQYAYTSIPFREKLKKDFAPYVNTFKDTHNLAGIVLHNEPGYFWMSDRIFDYSPSSIAQFRTWLEKEDGNIEVLNQHWGTKYASFADVVPPRKPSDIAAWMDWRHFSVHAVAEFLQWEADFCKSLRADLPRTTNLDGALNSWYPFRLANMLAYSRAMDQVGVDIYPSVWSDRDLVPYSMDMLQGVAQGRPADIMECEVFDGKNWQKYDEDQRAELLRSELWTMIGHGADAILPWSFAHNETNLTNGEFNSRILACRDIAHLCNMIGINNFHRQNSRVALCVDPDSYLYQSGFEKSPRELTERLDQEYEGFHAALADASIQSDVIFADQLRSGVWKRYDAIMLPFAVTMDQDLAQQLKDFVAGGGTLITAAPFSQADRWAKPFATMPGCGLDSMGFTLKTDASSQPQGQISTPQGTILVEKPVLCLPGKDTEILGTFDKGTPAITLSKVGRGKVYFIAGQVGAPYLTNSKGSGLSTFLAATLKQNSIQPSVSVQSDPQLNCSSMTDMRGNKFIVFSTLGASGNAAPPVQRATALALTDSPVKSAFIFPETRVENGTVRSGPVPIDITSEKNETHFTLPQIDSALPVMLATNAGPLLAVECPQTVAAGQAGEVTVTCFNPSASIVRGALELRSASGCTPITGKTQLEVAAFGQSKATFKFQAAAQATPRVPLSVFLMQPDSAQEISSIPVDVAVK